MPTNGELVLRILSTNLIPLAFTLIAPFCDLFSPIFIRDKDLLHTHKRHITYLIVGQSFLVGPLAAMVGILNFSVYGQNFGGVALAGVSVYFLIYTLLLVIYLRMGADAYDRQVLTVKWFYSVTPAAVIILSIVLSIVSQVN